MHRALLTNALLEPDLLTTQKGKHYMQMDCIHANAKRIFSSISFKQVEYKFAPMPNQYCTTKNIVFCDAMISQDILIGSYCVLTIVCFDKVLAKRKSLNLSCGTALKMANRYIIFQTV